MSKATPARCRVARRYIANVRLALAEPPVGTRPKAYSVGQRTPAWVAPDSAAGARKLLGFL